MYHPHASTPRSQSLSAAGRTPAEVADHIIGARANGRTLVAAYQAPNGFIHFDGRDADQVVAPALGMPPASAAGRAGLESRLNEPYGSLGIAGDSPLLDRLNEAQIVLVAVQSVLQMKEAQLLVDASISGAERRLPPLPSPRGVAPALNLG